MHHYEVFGLQVSSEIELDEVPIGVGGDVWIRKGEVARPHQPTFENDVYAIEDQLFYLRIPEVGRFQVENGQTILVDPEPGVTMEQLKLYLLGSCFGCLLHQRHVVPLHGSVIDFDGQGVLITGMSGAGKSTIANAFIDRGYSFVTDDVGAIAFKEDTPYVQLSYPSQKLWEDVVTRCEIGGTRAVTRQSEGRTKFSVIRKQAFAKKSVPLRFVFEICPIQNDVDIQMRYVTGIEKIKTLLTHTYRNELLAHLRPHESYLQQIMSIASQTHVYRIERPVDKSLEQEICDMIVAKIYTKV